MTRSELIVALLDLPPNDEDIIFEWFTGEGVVQFTTEFRPYVVSGQDSYGDRIVIGIKRC